MDADSKKKKDWVLREFDNLLTDKNKQYSVNNEFLNTYFKINGEEEYFYLLVYDYLDTCAKKGEFIEDEIDKKIFLKIISFLGLDDYYTQIKGTDSSNSDPIAYLKTLDKVRNLLEKQYTKAYEDYFKNEKKKNSKNITRLNLWAFYAVYMIYINYVKDTNTILCVKDLNNINEENFSITLKMDTKSIFFEWKKNLRNEANQILANFVEFIYEDDPDRKKKKAELEEFEEMLKSAILKSEIVEKNDGKASYILSRLFKAYITNAHQLPDEGLRKIVSALIDKRETFFKDEASTFNRILHELTITTVNDLSCINRYVKWERFISISENIFNNLKNGTSNEIKALLDGRKELYKFLNKVRDNKKLVSSLKNEMVRDSKDLQQVLRDFRRILDNPIINATPIWKSILTRGICDYIASMTDQEALNEYEKLYAGVMELV